MQVPHWLTLVVGVSQVTAGQQGSTISTLGSNRKKRVSIAVLPSEQKAGNLTLSIRSNLESVILDLQANRELLGRTYEGEKGGEVWCNYQGKIRGDATSNAAVSVCKGVRGLIVTQGRLLEVYPLPQTHTMQGEHLVVERGREDMHSCGVKGETNHLHHRQKEAEARSKRIKRDLKGDKLWIQGNTTYVELVVVVDNSLYKQVEKEQATQTSKQTTKQAINARVQTITNMLNMVYREIGIIVVLSHVEIWDGKDKIEVVKENSSETLSNFKNFAHEFKKDNPRVRVDNMQLLTGTKFENMTVGKATLGSICGPESVGVNMDSPEKSILSTVKVMSHEMGHNFGLSHIDEIEGCDCKEGDCIMLSQVGGLTWDPCSRKNISTTLPSIIADCLRNVPAYVARLDGEANCGNGLREDDEECDCGPTRFCQSPCCDPDTCKFTSNATCASGPCCDVETCQPITLPTICRPSVSECDVAEYCGGVTEECGRDVWYSDGSYCSHGEGLCYEGRCVTREGRCVEVWGEGATSCPSESYIKTNTKGDKQGNCGYQDQDTFTPCQESDAECGTLLCNTPKDARPAHYFYITKWSGDVNCRAISANKNYSERTWLVPEGAPCGDGQMCVNQYCVNRPLATSTKIFIAVVVVGFVLTFLFWDHIRYAWHHRGLKPWCHTHFYYPAACLDATVCPCMGRLNAMLLSVLPPCKCKICQAGAKAKPVSSRSSSKESSPEVCEVSEGTEHVDLSWGGRLEFKPAKGVSFTPLTNPAPTQSTANPVSEVIVSQPLLNPANLTQTYPSLTHTQAQAPPSPPVVPARPAPPPPSKPNLASTQHRSPPSVPPRPDPNLIHDLKPPLPPRP